MSDISPTEGLLNAADSLERENEKLKVIVTKLMARVERASNDQTQGGVHFERAIALEGEVNQRTQKLEEALDILHATNANLAAAQHEAEEARRDLATAVETIHEMADLVRDYNKAKTDTFKKFEKATRGYETTTADLHAIIDSERER